MMARRFAKISKEELKKMLDKKENFILVNVLDPPDYAEGHIPGSLNIPADMKNFEEKFKKSVPDKEDTVVLYCFDGSKSLKAIKKAARMRYKNLYYYPGGLNEWMKAGYPLHVHLISEHLKKE